MVKPVVAVSAQDHERPTTSRRPTPTTAAGISRPRLSPPYARSSASFVVLSSDFELRCASARAAGSCCVRQWSVPRPQTRSTAWMPTTWRDGMRRASVSSAIAIVRVVERRHEHDAVGDVEVGVARRQPLAVHHHRPRERERDDAQWSTAGQLEPAKVVHRPLVVVVGRIRFDSEHHRLLVHEARDVVHVPVRVVAHAAFAEPDRPVDAQPLGEDTLVVLRVESPGLRTCTSLSSHSSVTSSRPAPLTSMPPPSRTIRSPVPRRGSSSRRPARSAIRRPMAASSRQLSYFAQPLKPQDSRHELVAFEARRSARSRAATRGRSARRGAARDRPGRRAPRALRRALSRTSSEWHRISTGSCAARTRAISA